jgi:hypothetical protein
VLDHTSTLRFLETRFGVTAPNLTAWRRATVGDMTGALNLAAKPRRDVPPLPKPQLTDQRVLRECIPAAIISEAEESSPLVPIYPVPPNSMPAQEPGTASAPSGACGNPGTVTIAGSTGALVSEQAGAASVTALPLTAAAGSGAGAAMLGAAAVLAGVGWLGRRRAQLAAENDAEG